MKFSDYLSVLIIGNICLATCCQAEETPAQMIAITFTQNGEVGHVLVAESRMAARSIDLTLSDGEMTARAFASKRMPNPDAWTCVLVGKRWARVGWIYQIGFESKAPMGVPRQLTIFLDADGRPIGEDAVEMRADNNE
jgi:hypothetical protein